MRVKICGIRSAVDVDLVNAYRPDWIGLVIDVPSSFRSVTIEQARALSKRVDEGIGVVGVFVDCPLDTIASLLEAACQAGASWIDVSSAVETDQKKDGEKMKALIARCRRERQ